ncbi:MAG: MnhB domain-containing protein [Halobacteriaceae archaeon]
MTTTILRTTARTVVPLIIVVSVALFVQGHNQPGGGFIAGVLTTTAFALVYITYGIDFLEEQVFDRTVEDVVSHLQHGIVADYRRLFVVGLAVAAGSGLVPLYWDVPFLAQDHWYVHGVPLWNKVHVASAIVFDLGVYFVVVGALLTILSVVGAE